VVVAVATAIAGPASSLDLAGEWIGTIGAVDGDRCHHELTVYFVENGARFAGSLSSADGLSGELYGEAGTGTLILREADCAGRGDLTLAAAGESLRIEVSSLEPLDDRADAEFVLLGRSVQMVDEPSERAATAWSAADDRVIGAVRLIRVADRRVIWEAQADDTWAVRRGMSAVADRLIKELAGEIAAVPATLR